MFKIFSLLIILLVSGCNTEGKSERDGEPKTKVNALYAPNPTPRIEKRSRYGNKKTYTVKGKKYHVLKTAKNYHKIGIASWYGTKFHGRLTSSREPYNMFALTAASKELPIPCYVKVKNLSNGRTAIVRVNDRGPFKPGRIMDLSYAAAQKIGMLNKGTAKVEITYTAGLIDKNKNHERKSSISLGLFSNKSSARKTQKKISKYKVLKPNFLIRKDENYQLIVGPIANTNLKKAYKTLRQLHLPAKII